MSEYTYGNLILAKDTELCKKYLDPSAYLIGLDSKWVCLLNEQDKYFMDDIRDRPVSENILELSKQTPVLFFANPEDHGFGFAIIENGETTSSMYFDHEAHEDIFFPDGGMEPDMSMIDKLFQNHDLDDEKLRAMGAHMGLDLTGIDKFIKDYPSGEERIQAMSGMLGQVFGPAKKHDGKRDIDAERATYFKKVLADFDAERFSVFGYGDEQIEALKALFTPESILGGPFETSGRFKDILGLYCMSFVAWDYIRFDEEEGREEVFKIIARPA